MTTYAHDYAKLDKAYTDLLGERDFLADQVSKFESVVDEKQDTVDRLSNQVAELHRKWMDARQEIMRMDSAITSIARTVLEYYRQG